MEWCYRKLAKICGAPRQHLQMEIMRRGSCGEYSARQSAALQSAVQSRGPGREPPLILSSLHRPPSSLSLDPRRPGARSRAADWMPMTRGCSGGWAERLGPCPHPPPIGRGAARGGSIQPCHQQTQLHHTHLFFARASRFGPKGRFLDESFSIFLYFKCRLNTDRLSLTKGGNFR